MKSPGLPDGMKVDKDGNLFATGPGGVLIFAPDGTHLGTLATGQATANCGWGEDGSVRRYRRQLYVHRAYQDVDEGEGVLRRHPPSLRRSPVGMRGGPCPAHKCIIICRRAGRPAPPGI